MPKPTRPAPGPNVPTPVPNRNDRVNFASRGDATMTALPPAIDGVNTNIAYVADALDYVDEQFDLIETAADQAGEARDQAELASQTAVNAPGTSGTSSTSMTVGSGNKTFTTQQGKAWVVGQPVVISRTSAPSTVQMYGVIASYNSGTGSMTVTVPADGVVGSGTLSDWTIALTGRRGMAGILPVWETTGDTVGAYGFCYHIMGNHKLTLPALGTVDQEIEFYNMSGLTTPTVDFGSTKLTTITGIKTPGLMTLEFPGCGARLRCTANATYGFRA